MQADCIVSKMVDNPIESGLSSGIINFPCMKFKSDIKTSHLLTCCQPTTGYSLVLFCLLLCAQSYSSIPPSCLVIYHGNLYLLHLMVNLVPLWTVLRML